MTIAANEPSPALTIGIIIDAKELSAIVVPALRFAVTLFILLNQPTSKDTGTITHRASSNHLYKLISRIAVLALFSLSFAATGNSQNVPQDPRIFGGPERKLYNGVPTKLPLEIDVRNVTSDRWVHDLEIEVTNTSDKPIYYVDMRIFLVGAKAPVENLDISYWLKYGRINLISISEPVIPEDVPIKPGGKHTFKISESDAKSWDFLRTKEGRAEPKYLKVLFQNINFGDGTGFATTSGEPVNIHRKISRAGPSRLEPRFDGYPQIATCFLPATLPVKSYMEESIKLYPAIAPMLPQVNCGVSWVSAHKTELLRLCANL